MQIYNPFSTMNIEILIPILLSSVTFHLSDSLAYYLHSNIHFSNLQYTLRPLAILHFCSKNLQLALTHHLLLNNPLNFLNQIEFQLATQEQTA